MSENDKASLQAIAITVVRLSCLVCNVREDRWLSPYVSAIRENSETSAEWQVMNALWQEHPATAREIEERLPPGTRWAYTTIRTMLTRLVEKEVVSERKRTARRQSTSR